MLLLRILTGNAVMVFGWCFLLIAMDRLRNGGGNADNGRDLDNARSVTFWETLEVLGALLAYQLQFRVLKDLVTNGVVIGDPLFSNLFGTAVASNAAVMAALLVTLTVVGAMAAAHAAITLIGIVGMAAGGELADRGNLAGAVEQGLLQTLFLILGIFLVIFDARVFAQQWVLDADSRKYSANVFESVAFYAYLAFLPLLSAKLYLAYRNLRQPAAPTAAAAQAEAAGETGAPVAPQPVPAAPVPSAQAVPLAAAPEPQPIPVAAAAPMTAPRTNGNGYHVPLVAAHADAAPDNSELDFDPFGVGRGG